MCAAPSAQAASPLFFFGTQIQADITRRTIQSGLKFLAGTSSESWYRVIGAGIRTFVSLGHDDEDGVLDSCGQSLQIAHSPVQFADVARGPGNL